MSDNVCECPTRAALAELIKALDRLERAKPEEEEEESELLYECAKERCRAALVQLPCPCAGMREESTRHLQMAGHYSDLHGKAEAERNELRAELATRDEALKAEDSAQAELDKLLEYARTVKGSRDVHSIYEVLDLAPKLRAELAKAKSLNEYFRDAVGECHVMISRNTSEYQIRDSWEATELPPRFQQVMRRAETAEAELTASQERERILREALRRIEKYKPEEFDYTEDQKAAWHIAVAGCPECLRFAGHPIQRGICDEHRRFLYQREKTNTHRNNTQDCEMRRMARAAIDAASALATPEGTLEKPR